MTIQNIATLGGTASGIKVGRVAVSIGRYNVRKQLNC